VAGEVLFDDSGFRTQWIEPDPDGFTIRTQYPGTEDILDVNARIRGLLPDNFRGPGPGFHLVGRIPMEIYEQLHVKLGRAPNIEELKALINDRDYSKLKTREVQV
jgi:hypothetical protein